MKSRPTLAPAILLATLALTPTRASAATCNPACAGEIQSKVGLVENAIFTDTNGHDAFNLPVYGKLVDAWPGCPQSVPAACAGTSSPVPAATPYDCPGNYTCAAPPATIADASVYLNALDHLWWQPCRLADPTPDASGCPKWTCIADGTGGNYLPWHGLVFDLGGPSNKVAIFAQNDHGPQPCESLEYTVFLTDNPFAHADTDIVLDPATEGVNPMKWNRAVLTKIYTWGFFNTRAPDPAGQGVSCGDTADYAVEDDSFVQVFSLPCGITFRYASIVAGNDGRDFSNCAYDSSEAELDAIAGLTESGSAVCPDGDNDHYVDCACPGAPPVCDCNDKDATVHPGAPEACDSTTDLNCDNATGTPCTGGTVCHQSQCIPNCSGSENPYCPPGSTCTNVPDKGNLCVLDNCNCDPGQVCINNVCVDACANVTCPGTQVCLDGKCFDPCSTIQCPQGQLCQSGQCVFPCGCFAGDIGCGGGLVCNKGNPDPNADSNTCVPPTCKGVTCPAGQACEPITGTCVSFCNTGVQCPAGEKCVEPSGCVPLCQGVSCPAKFECDPKTGECVDTSCVNVTCLPPLTCMDGLCVTPDGGATGGGGQGGGGAGGSGGATSSSSSGGGADPGDQSKCGCRVPGEPEDGSIPGAGALALLGIAAAIARRRR